MGKKVGDGKEGEEELGWVGVPGRVERKQSRAKYKSSVRLG